MSKLPVDPITRKLVKKDPLAQATFKVADKIDPVARATLDKTGLSPEDRKPAPAAPAAAAPETTGASEASAAEDERRRGRRGAGWALTRGFQRAFEARQRQFKQRVGASSAALGL